MALEEMGTTFIKLGQILSTRPDLLPPAYISELAKLRDRAPQAPVGAIRRCVEDELGAPISRLFNRFDEQPIASASIGQVHAATLHSGTEVVVKVQKPGVRRQVETDLEILTELSRRLGQTAGGMYDFGALVEEFAWTIRGELGYVAEARNMAIFQNNFAGQPWIRVPSVCSEHTTSRVLTMERLDGAPIEEALAAAGDAGNPELAGIIIRWILKQIFEDGFFHADPHPGNLFLLEGGVLGVVDFGMVGLIAADTSHGVLLSRFALRRRQTWRLRASESGFLSALCCRYRTPGHSAQD
jgi:ubiquinone biosynthesis protein